jgi:hypothetical protein
MTCEAFALDEAKIDNLNDVTNCAPEGEKECYAIEVDGGTTFTITGQLASGELVPRKIEAIFVERFVIVT